MGFCIVFLIGIISAVELTTTYNPFTQAPDYYSSGNFSGSNVSADYFIGDGSLITGISGTANDSFNQSLTDTLYAPIGAGSDNSSWNQSLADTLYSAIIWGYNQTQGAMTYTDEVNASQTSWIEATFIKIANFFTTSDITNMIEGNKSEIFTTADSNYSNLTTWVSSQGYLTTYSESDPAWTGNMSNVSTLSKCPSGQFIVNLTSYGVDCATDAGDISAVYGDMPWLFNGSTSGIANLTFNDTLMNETIDMKVTAGLATKDECSEISGCVVGALTTETDSAALSAIAGNESAWLSTYNSTYDAKVTDNETWSQSLASTLYADISVTGDNTTWNQALADTLYSPLGVAGDNESFNQSLTDSLYASISVTGDNSTWSQSLADTLYAGIIWAYNQTTPAITVSNAYTDSVNNSQATYSESTYLKIANMFTTSDIVSMISGNRSEIESNTNSAISGNSTADRSYTDSAVSGNVSDVYTNVNSAINGNYSSAISTSFAAADSNYSNLTTWVTSLGYITGYSESDPGWSGNISSVLFNSDLPLENQTLVSCSNITGASYDVCAGDGASGGNPFDQSLNTTDQVQFTGITLSEGGNISNSTGESYIKFSNGGVAVFSQFFILSGSGLQSCEGATDIIHADSEGALYCDSYSPGSGDFSGSEFQTAFDANLSAVDQDLNVNSSNYWDGLGTINSTQMEDNGGTLNILVSWLTSLFYTEAEVDAALANQDECSEITGCVTNSITSTNVAFINESNTFSLDQTFSSNLGIGGNISLTSGLISLINPADTNGLVIDQNGNASTSTSVGGAVLLENTGSTGAGMIIYSNRGSDAAGRLLNIRADNSLFPQAAFHIDYDGTANAAEIVYNNNDSSGETLDMVSYNEQDTTLGVSGMQTGKGVIKVTHNQPSASDANSAAISILLNGVSTAAQGIFLDTQSGYTTIGDLINLRQNTNEVFVVEAEGNIQNAGNLSIGGTNISMGECSENWNGTCSIKTCPTTELVMC